MQPLDSPVVPPLSAAPPAASSLLGHASAPVPASDSAPILYLSPWLSRCPEPELRALGRMALSCSVARHGSGSGQIYLSVLPAPADFDLEAACSAEAARAGAVEDADAQQVNVPVVVALSPAFRTTRGAATLTCALTVGDAPLPVVSVDVPIAVQGTHWAIISDAIVLEAGRADAMNSTLFGPARPTAVAAAMAAAGCGAVPTYADGPFAACALKAAQVVWGNTTAPDVGTAAVGKQQQPMEVVATRATLLILRAPVNGSFSPSSVITVGGEPASVSAVSPDGRWLSFFTPNASVMCGPTGAAVGRCGPAALVVTTPPDDEPLGDRGSTIACPPMCPGDFARASAAAGAGGGRGGRIVPAYNGTASFSLAMESSLAAGVVEWLSPAAPFSLAPGIAYEPACQARGFTDPASGACTNSSDPASTDCALGSRDSCETCPAAALCPGGDVLWARPGYWSDLTPCDGPEPSSRCVKYDPDSSTIVCGPAYRQDSYRCDACGECLEGEGTRSQRKHSFPPARMQPRSIIPTVRAGAANAPTTPRALLRMRSW